ncbi:cytochrome c family protein [uncultured Devosia sp.]|uniref:c-type cytochrome n=1 Tax=uncultured Devosia sp. TaxID=211434 RepID=UPI0026069A93|nr:cytochrome c family protein [uncultured Devosia sp.]
MDSFELNKIIGAVLGTLLFVMGVGFLAEAIYHPIENRGPGYALPEPEVAEGGAPVEEEPAVPLSVLLASASAERGAAAVRKCQSCHNFGEGEANKQGPLLYDVVGAVQAHVEDFAYSDILMQHHNEGLVWSYENLDAFLTNPKGYAPGTKMSFAGVRSPEERADILAYLQTLSANPVPFPAPEAVPAEGEDAAGSDDTIPEELLTPAEGGSEETVVTAPEAAAETATETRDASPVVGTPVQETTPAAPESGGAAAPEPAAGQ